MILAAVLLALAAALGATLAVRTAQGRDRPLGLALTHGAFAAAGLVALLVVVLGDSPTMAGWSLAVLGVAAVGGFALFGLDRSGRSLSVPMILGHGAVAVVGFLLLLAAAFGAS